MFSNITCKFRFIKFYWNQFFLLKSNNRKRLNCGLNGIATWICPSLLILKCHWDETAACSKYGPYGTETARTITATHGPSAWYKSSHQGQLNYWAVSIMSLLLLNLWRKSIENSLSDLMQAYNKSVYNVYRTNGIWPYCNNITELLNIGPKRIRLCWMH